MLKRWGLKICLAAFLVFITMGVSRDSLATEDIQPDWAGFYDITITTAESGQVPAEVELRDWGNGQLAIHGVFQGYSLNQLGEYSGDAKGEGLKAHFDINQFGLARGFIDLTVLHSEGRYTMEGQGSVESFAVGKMTATFSGQRRQTAPAPPSSPAPIPETAPAPVPDAESPNYMLWATGAALLVLAAAITSRRRRHGSRR